MTLQYLKLLSENEKILNVQTKNFWVTLKISKKVLKQEPKTTRIRA